ncbi:MAG: NADP-dependent oxidoreductase [Ktedonobacteraceae bacterium]|nr:NADP-dependent oxidoreductase [Ktedonobacteraceae bacterium]
MSTQNIQAIRVHSYGDADQLKLEHIQRPEPQAGEVLVQVHAAGVNPMDWKIRRGYFKDVMPVRFPYIPGLEMAGVVEEVGPGVTAFQKGQAVYGQSMKGTYAEYIVAGVESLGLKPQSLSFDEAATVPVGATTAWQGLFDYGKLEAGQRVLIQGAAGGVGLFAVQFAKWKGAHVLATTSSTNVDFVRSLGAETVIDYTTTALADVVQDVDLAFALVGGPALEDSLQAIKRGGTLVTIAGQPATEKVQERGVHVTSFHTQVESDLLQTFARLIDEGQIKVAIEQIFPLSEASQAHELSQQGHGRGRIVLRSA